MGAEGGADRPRVGAALGRVAAGLLRLLGSGEIRHAPGVTYHRRRRRGRVMYDAVFAGGVVMRVRPHAGRVYDDLSPDPRRLLAAGIRGQIAPGSRVLDVGCGTGASSAVLAEGVGRSGSVVGLEADAESVRFARRRYTAGHLGYERMEPGALGGEADGAFDAAVVNGALLIGASGGAEGEPVDGPGEGEITAVEGGAGMAGLAEELVRLVCPPGPIVLAVEEAGQLGALRAMHAAIESAGVSASADRPWRGMGWVAVRIRLRGEGGIGERGEGNGAREGPGGDGMSRAEGRGAG